MGRYCYQSSLTDFLNKDKEVWISEMRDSFSQNSSLPLSQSQIHAWEDCFDVLNRELPDFNVAHPGFSIIFEYMLPYESGRRSSPNCGVNCSSRIFAYAASSNAC